MFNNVCLYLFSSFYDDKLQIKNIAIIYCGQKSDKAT